ncbi:unnamed protein product [Phytophthora lilii]|uniref:Unnamed protein product n=1 Tax=Phytophthora lilii TaxID=2077276 RepID=A0A9W6TZ99_9STRA|nr:unnamed protein product [Phytophthora lilii]
MTANTRRATVTSAGRFGIGTGSPSAILDVSGSVSSTIDIAGSGVAYFLISGAGAGFYTTSDKRIKKDIEPISESVGDSILELNPVQYRFESQGDEVPLQIGYIAQDAI